MNQRPQHRPAAAPVAKPAASTPAEIRKLAEELMDVMSALLATIERETELVRAGKVAEAMRLAQQKSEMSRRYVMAVEGLKAAQKVFAQMTSGLKGEGPYGDTPGTGVWRSMLTEQYSKNFAKAGGVGISNDVFRTLIMQQANHAG